MYIDEKIREHAIDGLKDLKGTDPEASEVHHKLFNEDYFIIGTTKAEKWLEGGKDGVFGAIEKIKEYEQDNFGSVSTDFSDPEKVANMYAYILGEELLQQSEVLRDKWNDYLSDEMLDAIIQELQNL